ncbi:MAG: hypothetical protein XD95_0049 [Microgenomates bacterium 39_7]|nr:MAG: hypothetical protein XD95_0049 [Microgenomates bacterium 39_7]
MAKKSIRVLRNNKWHRHNNHSKPQTMIKKQPWIKYFIIFIFTVIVIAAIIRVITPQTDELLLPPSDVQKKNLDQSVSIYNNIEFVGSTSSINLSQEVGIYSNELAGSEDSLDELITTIVTLFDLTRDPELPDKEFYVGDSYTLSRSTLRDELMLSRSTSPEVFIEQISNPPPGGIDTQQAISRAAQFVNSIFGEHQYIPQSDNVVYLEGILEPNPSTEREAHYAEISFAQQIDSLPVILDQELSTPIMVMVSNNYLIQKAVFRIKEFSPQKIAEVNLLSIEEAVDRLNQDSVGSIIGIAQEEPELLSLSQINGGILESAELEYRYDSELKLIYPFYRFTGTLIDDLGQSFQAEIIAPAIKVQL